MAGNAAYDGEGLKPAKRHVYGAPLWLCVAEGRAPYTWCHEARTIPGDRDGDQHTLLRNCARQGTRRDHAPVRQLTSHRRGVKVAKALATPLIETSDRVSYRGWAIREDETLLRQPETPRLVGGRD
eukprot:scaffold41704_cov31-Tisochrysis_lutea.AAC.2